MLLAGLRQPTLLTQQLASLDALAGGRLRAGFGAGFPSPESERQFTPAGVPFATRTSRLEETVALMRALWSGPGEPASYTGTHMQASGVVLSPAPARAGGPPIWLAGAGAQAGSRVGRRYIVVRRADESHRGLDSAGAVVQRLARLAP